MSRFSWVLPLMVIPFPLQAQSLLQDYSSVISITASTQIAAADSPVQQQSALTIQAAINLALTNYPSVQIALQRVLAADANVLQIKTQNLPQANLLWQTNRSTYNNITGLMMPQGTLPSLSGTVLNTTSNRSIWNSAGGLLVGWEPTRFGYRHAEGIAAQAAKDATQDELSLTKLDVATAAATAFLNVTAAQEQVRSAQADLDRRKSFANTIHKLVDNQLRPGADASEADAEVAAAQIRLIQATTAVQIGMAALKELLAIPNMQMQLDGTPLLQTPASSSREQAVNTHPFVLEQEHLQQQQKAEEKVISRAYLPRLTLEGLISGRGSGVSPNGTLHGGTDGLALTRENWAVGVQATFAPLDYFSIREQRKIAAAKERSQELNYKKTVALVNRQVEQADARYNGALQIAQNTPVQLQAARMAESQARARYQAGLTNIVEVTQAEALLQQSEVQDTLARIDTWRALLDLNAAQGDIAPFLNQLNSNAGGH